MMRFFMTMKFQKSNLMSNINKQISNGKYSTHQYILFRSLILMSICFSIVSRDLAWAQVFKIPPLPAIDESSTNANSSGNGNTPRNNAGDNIIVRPQQPITSPGIGGGFNPILPWQPGRPGFPGSGINLNYTCPLIDQEGTGDLIASLDVLAKAIPQTSSCREEANYDELAKKQLEMRKSANEIKSFWDNFDQLWTKVEGKTNEEYIQQINGFGKQVSSLMENVKYISESLGRNELLNSNCGKEMFSKGKTLNALSDLITQLNPYAVFAISAGVDISVIGPIIAGFSGLSSLVKTVSNMNKNNLFDMNQSENRLTVLKATCEYMRIDKKLRYVLLSYTGNGTNVNKLNQLNEVLNTKNDAINQLKKNFFNQKGGEDLSQILKVRKEFYGNINMVREQLKKDWLAYEEVESYVRENVKDENGFCHLGRALFNRKKRNQFPYNIDSNIEAFEKIVDSAEEDISYAAAKAQFLASKNELTENSFSVSTETTIRNFPVYNRVPSCGVETQNLIQHTKIFLQALETQVLKSEKSFEQMLRKYPIYRDWYTQDVVLSQERDQLQRTVQVITRTSASMTPAGQTEVIQRLDDLRHSLFGTNESFPLNNLVFKVFGFEILNVKNQSPFGGWFEHTDRLQAEAASVFIKSMENLSLEIKDRVEQHRKKQNITARWVDKINSKKPFDLAQGISAKLYPRDHEKKIICGKLEEVFLNWQKIRAHIDAMKNACSFIQDSVNASTGQGVTNYCAVPSTNKESFKTLSRIQKIENDLGLLYIPQSANIVVKKMKELSCTFVSTDF